MSSCPVCGYALHTGVCFSEPEMTTSQKLDHTLQAYGHLERKNVEARSERNALRELLGEVATSGVAFDEPRVGYVEVQINRATWNQLQDVLRGSSSNVSAHTDGPGPGFTTRTPSPSSKVTPVSKVAARDIPADEKESSR